MGYELRRKCRQDISQQSVPGAAERDVMGEDDAHAAKGTEPKYSVKLRLKTEDDFQNSLWKPAFHAI